MDRLILLITAWTHTHQIIVVSITGGIALITLVFFAPLLRWFLQWFQDKAQAEEARQQLENKRDHRTRTMIRQAEDWRVDTSALRILWDREKFSRHLRAQSQHYHNTSLLPMAVFMLLAILSLPFPFHRTTAFSDGLIVLTVLSLGWWTWSSVQAFRLMRMAHRVTRLPTKPSDHRQK